LQSIESFSVVSNQGTWEALTTDEYRTINHGLTARLDPALGTNWPSPGYKTPDAIIIEAKLGHAPLNSDSDAIDTDNITDLYKYDLAKQAILILIADWFRNREDTAPVQLYNVPNAFRAICNELSVELL
jgi:hypothetical protein